MKAIVSAFLTALLAYTVGLFNIPWYSFAITTFVVFLAIPQAAGKSFLIGFASLFVLWGLMALITDINNEHLLSKKVATIFNLHQNYQLLILITAFVGGLVAAFAALSGSLCRNMFAAKRKKY